MTSQPSRRVRRRQFTDALQEQPPRPGSPAPASAPAPARTAPRRTLPSHREHHVTTDYGYVHKDLLTVLGVGIVTIAFIIGMSFAV